MLELGCEERCPACRHRSLTDEESLAQKTAFLRRRLEPWPLEPVVASPRRWGYRRKVCLRAWYESGWHFGVRTRDRELVAIPHCPVQDPLVNAALRELGAQLPPDFPLVYYVQHGAQATLVVRAPAELTVSPLPGVAGLWTHLNPSAGRRIFGKLPWTLVYGEPRSRDEFGLWHGPSAFSQVIPELVGKALDLAQEWLGTARVLDLCCGTGASLSRWPPGALGVELGKEAVECARVNAPEAEVLRGTCAQRLPQLETWISKGPYSLYANPPRLGLEEPVRSFLKKHPPTRAAYLSCSAGTLRRDLDDLEWKVDRLVPFDFFPGTNHVEVLALATPSTLHRPPSTQ